MFSGVIIGYAIIVAAAAVVIELFIFKNSSLWQSAVYKWKGLLGICMSIGLTLVLATLFGVGGLAVMLGGMIATCITISFYFVYRWCQEVLVPTIRSVVTSIRGIYQGIVGVFAAIARAVNTTVAIINRIRHPLGGGSKS